MLLFSFIERQLYLALYFYTLAFKFAKMKNRIITKKHKNKRIKVFNSSIFFVISIIIKNTWRNIILLQLIVHSKCNCIKSTLFIEVTWIGDVKFVDIFIILKDRDASLICYMMWDSFQSRVYDGYMIYPHKNSRSIKNEKKGSARTVIGQLIHRHIQTT